MCHAGRQALQWLTRVPAAECLRCGDVVPLMTAYRRVAPLALTATGQAASTQLGTLAHVAADQLRLADMDRVLTEFKVLHGISGKA